MSTITVASCLIIDNDKILLVKEKDASCWKLPGGKVDKKETEKNVAIDQTRHISGMDARIIQMFGVYEYQKDDDNFEEHVFEADISPEGNSEINSDDDFEAKWFKLSSAKKEELCEEIKLVFEDL